MQSVSEKDEFKKKVGHVKYNYAYKIDCIAIVTFETVRETRRNLVHLFLLLFCSECLVK